MQSATPEHLSTGSERYANAIHFAGHVINQSEKGYVYAFPDKRLYTQVEGDPGSYVEQAWDGYEGPVGLYLHVPYCTPKPAPPDMRADMRNAGIDMTDGRTAALCSYCNLFTDVRESFQTGEYARQVVQELAMYRRMFAGRRMSPSSLYFGGGSPSLLALEDLRLIRNAMQQVVGTLNDAVDQTLECIPDSVDPRYLHGVRQIGFTRVSFGVQTFDEKILAQTGRNYHPETAMRAILDAKQAGFLDVNGDLIIGLPNMSRETFMQDVEIMQMLGPTTITMYQNMVREGTRYGSLKSHGKLTGEVSQEEIYAWTEEADVLLSRSGYRRVALTCWAKQGGGYKQGQDIYDRVPILGVGSGARSYGPHAHYGQEYVTSTGATRRAIADWKRSVDNGEFPRLTGVVITDDLKERAAAVFGLMSEQGVSMDQVQQFNPEIRALSHLGLVRIDEGRVHYTSLGKVYSGALSRLFYGDDMLARLQSYEVK